MTEPAKDEAVLLERLAKEVMCDGNAFCNDKESCLSCFAKADAALAAIRAAGWAVVPVEPTWKMIRVMDNYDDMMQDETTIQWWKDTLAAAPGVKP
jgi:hypothetical protein